METSKKTGFILAAPSPKSFRFGGETGIAAALRVQDGNWTKYLPTPEKQNRMYTYAGTLYNFDVLACVTFSALNNVEIQLKQMIATGALAGDNLAALRALGFFDDQGNFNASDRFTAKMSGTTREGNTLEAVADSIRNDGLLPESDWTFPDVGTDPDANWNAYYAEIPQALKDKAKKILDILTFSYEWLLLDTPNQDTVGTVKRTLFSTPMQIAAPVCWPWNTTDIIKKCDDTTAGHATTIYDYTEEQFFNDFDHYATAYKKLAWDYFIPYAFRYFVTLKQVPVAPVTPHYRFNMPLSYGQKGTDIVALQDVLKYEGFMSSKVLSTGYFGDVTATALKAWQVFHGLNDFANESDLTKIHFGSKSIAVANNLYAGI
jgi:hypothetical protein